MTDQNFAGFIVGLITGMICSLIADHFGTIRAEKRMEKLIRGC